MNKLEQQLTERPNRDSDCERMRMYYRWQCMNKQDTQIKDDDNNQHHLHLYNDLWNTYGIKMTNKPHDELKAYLIIKITEEITDCTKQERARRFIIENASNCISWEYLKQYTSTRHRPRNTTPTVFSKKRRVYHNKKTSTPSQKQTTSDTFLPPTEIVQFTIPVLFRHGTPYSSFIDMTSSLSVLPP